MNFETMRPTAEKKRVLNSYTLLIYDYRCALKEPNLYLGRNEDTIRYAFSAEAHDNEVSAGRDVTQETDYPMMTALWG